MTWRTAFTNLSNIAVTGVITSYDLNEIPNALPAADLPALAPSFPQTLGVLGEDQGGMSTLTYDGGAWTATMFIDHVLYWQPAWSEGGLATVLPSLITAVDAYLTAFKNQGTLSGILSTELEITRVLPGIVEYAGVKYYGVKFRHLWRRVL